MVVALIPSQYLPVAPAKSGVGIGTLTDFIDDIRGLMSYALLHFNGGLAGAS